MDEVSPDTEVVQRNELLGPTWRISSLGEADWALERISRLKDEIEANEKMVGEKIAFLKARLSELNGVAEHSVSFFTNHLRLYLEDNKSQLLSGPKKSRALPHGSIGVRTVGESLEVTDLPALIEWAIAQDDSELVRVKTEPALAAIKKRFKATGELPAGMDITGEREEFVLKLESERGGK